MVNFKMPIRKEVDVQVPIATIITRCSIQCTMQHTTYNVQHAQLQTTPIGVQGKCADPMPTESRCDRREHCCDRHITCCMQHKIHNMQHAACNMRRTTCRVQRGSLMVDAHRSLWAYDCVALGWAVQIVGVQDPIHLEEPFTVQVCLSVALSECCGRIHPTCGYNAVTTQVIGRLVPLRVLRAATESGGCCFVFRAQQ